MVKDRYPTVVWFSASRERRLNSTVARATRKYSSTIPQSAAKAAERAEQLRRSFDITAAEVVFPTGQRIWIRESEEYVAPPYTL